MPTGRKFSWSCQGSLAWMMWHEKPLVVSHSLEVWTELREISDIQEISRNLEKQIYPKWSRLTENCCSLDQAKYVICALDLHSLRSIARCLQHVNLFLLSSSSGHLGTFFNFHPQLPSASSYFQLRENSWCFQSIIFATHVSKLLTAKTRLFKLENSLRTQRLSLRIL